MLREIRELGFEYAELSHGIRISLIPGIYEAVDAGEIKISSVHNFCPLPMGIQHAAPNIFKFTSSSRGERENARKHTLKTIETARRVNSSVVVLHMGRVGMRDYTEKLIQLAAEGKKDSKKYEKLCETVLEKREKRKEKPSEFADEMLKSLEEEARQAGVRLVIENREALEEIPFEGDFPFWLRQWNQETFGYWHDTGHAQIKENLGFILHQFHLENMTDRLLGFHIHDVEFPGRDHREPGTGTVDWKALKPLVKPEHIKVFEFSPSLSAEEVVRGASFVRDLWGAE